MKISGLFVLKIVFIVLHVVVTLLVVSTIPEKNVSKFIMVKNRLCNNMSGLAHLWIFSYENIEIDTDHIINKFADNNKLLEKVLWNYK